MSKTISLLWTSKFNTSHKESLLVECPIFLNFYVQNPKLKPADHNPYFNFKSQSPLIEEEFHVKEYVVIYLFKLLLCVPNLTSIASINCTQCGLQNRGYTINYGVTQKVVHSTMHPPLQRKLKKSLFLNSCINGTSILKIWR